MSPSLEEMELTAAPYLGKGLGIEEVNVRRRCDQGYNEAFTFCCGGALRNFDEKRYCQHRSKKNYYLGTHVGVWVRDAYETYGQVACLLRLLYCLWWFLATASSVLLGIWARGAFIKRIYTSSWS